QVDGAARSALARRVPYAKLPGAGQPWRLPKGVTPTEGLTFCWRLGKGRVVRCDMRNPGGWSLKWKAGYESRGAYQMNAIRWAAGEDPATDVVFASGEERDDFCFAAPFLAFEVDTKDSGFNRVRCRLRTAENKVLKDEWKPLDAGRNLLSVDLRDVAAGEYYLDVIPAEKGFFSDAKSDFAAVHPFSRESTVGRFVIASTNITVIAEGSRPTLPVDWEAPLESDGKLLWEIYDTYKQLLIKGETPVKKGARGARFQFDAANFPTLSGFVQATLKDDAGVSIVEGRKTVFFPNHRFADYTMIIWESMYEQGMTELFAPTCVGELGYDNHLGESGWLSAAFNARAVPYITRVCLGGGREGTAWSGIPFPSGTNKEHKAQLEALKKDVNCYRPEIRRLFEEGFTPRVKKCAPYGVCVYNLGDECWYSDDIGFGDATDDGFFFDWLKKRYGTVERYNAAHGTSIKAFNEVRRMTTGEARKAGDWPAYFDQASYAAKMYSDTFQMCRAVIKKYDPKGRVGAEGSPAGNIDETVKNLEFWGPYGNFAMDEVLRSIAPDCVRGMWWGGYLRDPRDGFPGHQWEYLLTGRANGDQWFAGMSGSTEGAIAGDYTLAPFVRKMHKHHSQLKHGLASFMIRTPLRRDPFVIYYSWASCCAAPLSDEFTSPMIGCGNLVQFCYRRGLESSFVTPGSLKNLEGRRLVFLPSVCSLSDEEAAALKAFVKKGGKIYADSEPGVLDGFLARRKTPPLQGMWTKYGAKASDEELLAIVGTAGAKQTEFVEGLEWSRTVLRTRVLGDMKCVGFTCRTKNIGRKVTLGFGREGYIYEVDSGYVGTGDKVTVESLEKPFKLYAQFTAEQKLPEYPADRCEIAAGEKVNFETKALRKGSVYRLTVSDPEGKAIKCRERLICADPVKEPKIEVQFPYNDRAGGYSVSLTDIATGLTGVSKINVK
ncbi:MAG: hypothetical protein J6T01_06800, partial [Kiritimatiellae bacterium]|nr:hypothetical protein [Kiritimatiellia bacterium]